MKYQYRITWKYKNSSQEHHDYEWAASSDLAVSSFGLDGRHEEIVNVEQMG